MKGGWIMQIKSKKLKGFTLVELIVVIAIFSMIMFGALALILPDRKSVV